MQVAGRSRRGSGAAMRVEPPPEMKRRPCPGGASDFDPAGIEKVSMCRRIIRRRRPLYKATQASCRARPAPYVTTITVVRRAPHCPLVQQGVRLGGDGLNVSPTSDKPPVGSEEV